jgi:hypothetical protein
VLAGGADPEPGDDVDDDGEVLDPAAGWLAPAGGWLPLPWTAVPLTTTIAWACTPAMFRYTRAVPGRSPVTIPLLSTVATPGLFVHHTAPARSPRGASLPSASRP